MSKQDRSDYQKMYYLKNKQRILARQKERQLANKEAYLEYRREYKKAYMKTNMGIFHNRKGSARRRALKNGAVSGRYNFEQICENNKWVCVICSNLIDRTLKYPHKGALTVEHILPLALGGSDTENNVAPAHFGCNIANASTIRMEKRNV